MRKINQYLEKIVPLMQNSLLPSALFAAAVWLFCAYGNFTPAINITLHSLFYSLVLAVFLILLYFNRSKPIFFLAVLTLGYIVINGVKNLYGVDYTASAAYQNLSLFLPLNLLFFFFWPDKRLLSRINVWILLALFTQYAIVEQLSRHGVNLNIGSDKTAALSGLAVYVFMAVIIIAFAAFTRDESLMNSGMFFAIMCAFGGLAASAEASGLTIFFTTAVLIIITSLGRNIYNETYKDPLTGLDSRNSYIIHSRKFPLKYSIAIVSIDDYDKLQAFGKRNRNIITRLIAERICELEKEEHIYRYSEDEFVIVYRNLDKKETIQRVEEIRRAIASALFQYNAHKKALKLTVSAAVSEKKRSDASSHEVLLRVDKALQKTRRFSHNVTSPA